MLDYVSYANSGFDAEPRNVTSNDLVRYEPSSTYTAIPLSIFLFTITNFDASLLGAFFLANRAKCATPCCNSSMHKSIIRSLNFHWNFRFLGISSLRMDHDLFLTLSTAAALLKIEISFETTQEFEKFTTSKILYPNFCCIPDTGLCRVEPANFV